MVEGSGKDGEDEEAVSSTIPLQHYLSSPEVASEGTSLGLRIQLSSGSGYISGCFASHQASQNAKHFPYGDALCGSDYPLSSSVCLGCFSFPAVCLPLFALAQVSPLLSTDPSFPGGPHSPALPHLFLGNLVSHIPAQCPFACEVHVNCHTTCYYFV